MPFLLPTLLLIAAAAPAAEQEESVDGARIAQLIIRERIIIRLAQQQPRRAADITPLPPRMIVPMEEKKGPKCLAVDDLAGSAQASTDSVDLMMSDRTQMRAKLDADCPALDYYRGFYVRRPPDGKICAKRDVIRARSGGSCLISSFKRLKPKR